MHGRAGDGGRGGMITLTPAAEERIREQGAGEAVEPVHLRVAARLDEHGVGHAAPVARARLDEHGSIEYGLGFDEPRAGDAQVPGAGVVVLVAAASQEFLQDVILDYLEVEPGQFRFVFARGSEP